MIARSKLLPVQKSLKYKLSKAILGWKLKLLGLYIYDLYARVGNRHVLTVRSDAGYFVPNIYSFCEL